MDWLFPIWKTVMTGRKGKKTNRPPSILWVDFLSGESLWSLSYPVMLQPESWASPSQGADPQAGWNMTAPWRSNPWAGWSRSASQKLGPWAGRGMSTSLDPWTGGSLSRLRCDSFPRTRSLGRLKQVDLLGPLDWSWATPSSPEWPVLGRIKGL